MRTCQKIIREYLSARDYILQQNCKIKFIGVPVYSISTYNDVKGHLCPAEYLEADEEVIRQVNFLNRELESLNTELGCSTLKFNADLRDCRKKNKLRYHFDLLSDGLHPDELLSRKWLRKLEVDIVKECYKDSDIVDICVDPQELLAFTQQEKNGRQGDCK